MNPVTAYEYSILAVISGDKLKMTEIAKKLNVKNAKVGTRLHYFLTRSWVNRIDDYYFLSVPLSDFQIEKKEFVTKSRNTGNAKHPLVCTDHIPDDVKNQIGILCKAGEKRTAIAKFLGIPKIDVLMVMAERDYRSRMVFDDFEMESVSV